LLYHKFSVGDTTLSCITFYDKVFSFVSCVIIRLATESNFFPKHGFAGPKCGLIENLKIGRHHTIAALSENIPFWTSLSQTKSSFPTNIKKTEQGSEYD
jgi:hypothetical protein